MDLNLKYFSIFEFLWLKNFSLLPEFSIDFYPPPYIFKSDIGEGSEIEKPPALKI